MLITKIDTLFETVEKNKSISVAKLAKELEIPFINVMKIGRYLELLGFVAIDYKHVVGPMIKYVKSPEHQFAHLDEAELINKLKFYKSAQDIQAANKMLYDLYKYFIHKDNVDKHIYANVRNYYINNFMKKTGKGVKDLIKKLEAYSIETGKIVVQVDIIKQELSPIPFYLISLFKFSDLTFMVIEKIKDEVIGKISYKTVLKIHQEQSEVVKEYRNRILEIMKSLFVDISEEYLNVLAEYIVITSTGMGEIEFLLKDKHLEEVVINNAYEPVWVYHKVHGWLETNIILEDESKIVHYATLAGKIVDKTITSLSPMLDARLKSGDRVNATIFPITTHGNTLTIRKFAEHPWTITDFLLNKTIDYLTAAMVWTAIQYELSILIVGGTGSGKTSTLNIFSQFIPPNQRIISIEDTRELRLPKTLHWVPMETRLPNPEGMGGISMLNLIINSLRMRPDRIIVGEIRRKKEAEVLFEAMHTGHSVYATLHANTVQEAILRLTTEPIGVPKSLMSAIDLMFVQNRNRRTNRRRTFQIAELTATGDYNLLFQYDFQTDKLIKMKEPVEFYKTLKLFSGLSKDKVDQEIKDKIKILHYFTDKNITSSKEIAQIMSYYYIDKKYLMNKLFEDKKS